MIIHLYKQTIVFPPKIPFANRLNLFFFFSTSESGISLCSYTVTRKIF